MHNFKTVLFYFDFFPRDKIVLYKVVFLEL